ncbi:MAG TPA: hypothetical protein VD789_13360 [Thermomicrobiales bacterium]|nr:hypothetical protein [Thermomicrobiales bacterium]
MEERLWSSERHVEAARAHAGEVEGADTWAEGSLYLAKAQLEATLAVVAELRALREDLNRAG